MKKLFIFLIVSLPLIGQTQPIQFTKDSIPLVDGKVVFTVDFKFNLSKAEFHKRAYSFLTNKMNPYFGGIRMDNDNYTLSRITDYINIEDNAFQTFGMYMTYDLALGYKDGTCTMMIRDINYMEKGHFETQEKSTRELNMPEYSGKDIMIDKKYSLLLKRKISEKITDASLARINEVIKDLDLSFIGR